MTTGRKPTKSGKGEVKKLKVRRETLKDLDAKGEGVKGGRGTAMCQTRGCGPGSGG